MSNDTTLYDKRLKTSVEIDPSFDTQKDGIPTVCENIRNFWNGYGQDHTFELTIDFEPIGSKFQYVQQMENLRPIFDLLHCYDLLDDYTRILYTSLDFYKMFNEGGQADFLIFLNNPQQIIGEHFKEISFSDKFSNEQKNLPAIVLELESRDQEYVEKQHAHAQLGGAFPDTKYNYLAIPIASIIQIVVYKLK